MTAHDEGPDGVDQPHDYKAAGVDLRAAERSLALMADAVRATYTPGVLSGLGAFGGLFALPTGYREPVLVASTDGVGTKTVVAAALGRYGAIGRDLVNHCVNDILVQGAQPLFFLDYVASSKLEPQNVADVVTGAAEACREAGMALLGGETAEMPGVYQPGQLDVVGTIVGLVERDDIVDGATVSPGDVLLAFPSGGLQTNGFSLARHLLQAAEWSSELEPGVSVGDALLAPHRSFLTPVRPLLGSGLVRAMAHVTGGGMVGNLPRVLPSGLGARVQRGTWPEPLIYALLAQRGDLAASELFEVFNMGVGFVLVVAEEVVPQVRELVAEPLYQIGVITEGAGVEVV